MSYAIRKTRLSVTAFARGMAFAIASIRPHKGLLPVPPNSGREMDKRAQILDSVRVSSDAREIFERAK